MVGNFLNMPYNSPSGPGADVAFLDARMFLTSFGRMQPRLNSSWAAGTGIYGNHEIAVKSIGFSCEYLNGYI